MINNLYKLGDYVKILHAPSAARDSFGVVCNIGDSAIEIRGLLSGYVYWFSFISSFRKATPNEIDTFKLATGHLVNANNVHLDQELPP